MSPDCLSLVSSFHVQTMGTDFVSGRMPWRMRKGPPPRLWRIGSDFPVGKFEMLAQRPKILRANTSRTGLPSPLIVCSRRAGCNPTAARQAGYTQLSGPLYPSRTSSCSQTHFAS